MNIFNLDRYGYALLQIIVYTDRVKKIHRQIDRQITTQINRQIIEKIIKIICRQIGKLDRLIYQIDDYI